MTYVHIIILIAVLQVVDIVATGVLWGCAAISALVAANNLWVIKRGRK